MLGKDWQQSCNWITWEKNRDYNTFSIMSIYSTIENAKAFKPMLWLCWFATDKVKAEWISYRVVQKYDARLQQ